MVDAKATCNVETDRRPERRADDLIDPDRPLRSLLLLVLCALGVFAAWRFRTKAVQDLALGGAFIYALIKTRRGFLAAWMNPAGWLALCFLLLAALLIPLGVDPDASLGVVVKRLDFVLFALALPVLLSTRRRVILFMCACALAISALVTWDLVRLLVLYGVDVLDQARMDPNPILIHPNISAAAAAVAAVLAAAVAWSQRRSRGMRVAALLLVLLNVLYVVVLRSRGAQLALLVSVGLSTLMCLRGWRGYLLWALGLAGCIAALLVVNPRFLSHGVLDRDVVWQHTLTLVGQRPLVGYGVGETVFMETYHASNPPASPHHFYHPHMYWLNAVFCFGWPAAVIQGGMWMLLLLRLARRICMERETGGHAAAVGAFGLIVLLHVLGLFDVVPNIVGLAMLWSVPLGLAAAYDEGAAH